MNGISICWDITSCCNDDCSFCYREKQNLSLNIDDNLKILKKLIRIGAKKISFVGGEPLLYPHLIELLDRGREYGGNSVEFSITTNGILLTSGKGETTEINQSLFDILLSKIDWLSLSLDGYNSASQTAVGRNENHFYRIVCLLTYLKSIDSNVKVKINTLVCKKNIDDIHNILSVVAEYNVSRWKLFRFLPSRGNAKESSDKYYISEDTYMSIVQTQKVECERRGIRLTINSYDDFQSYISITSDGFLSIYKNGSYSKPLNILTGNENEIPRLVNLERHISRRRDYIL